MRTQIKRRMLALWLSVCMVLTMMPSMAVPAFAAIGESNLLQTIRVGNSDISFVKKEATIDSKNVYEGTYEGEFLAATDTITVTPSDIVTVKYVATNQVLSNNEEISKEFIKNSGVSKTDKITGLAAQNNIIYFEVTNNSDTEYFKLTLTDVKEAPDSITPTAEALAVGEKDTVTLNVPGSANAYWYKVLGEPITAATQYKNEKFVSNGYTPAANGITVKGVTDGSYIEVYGVNAEGNVVEWGITGSTEDNFVEVPTFNPTTVPAKDKNNNTFDLTLTNSDTTGRKYNVYASDKAEDMTSLLKSGTAVTANGKTLSIELTNALTEASKEVYVEAVTDGVDHKSARGKVTLTKYVYKSGAKITAVEAKDDALTAKETLEGEGSADLNDPTPINLEFPYKKGGSAPTITLTLSEKATAKYTTGAVSAPADFNKNFNDEQNDRFSFTCDEITPEKSAVYYIRVSSEGDEAYSYYKLTVSMKPAGIGALITGMTVKEETTETDVKVDVPSAVKTNNSKDAPEELTAVVPYAVNGKEVTVEIKVSELAKAFSGATAKDANTEVEDGKITVEIQEIDTPQNFESKRETVTYIKVVSQADEGKADAGTYYKLTIKLAEPSDVATIGSLTVAGYNGTEGSGTGSTENPYTWTVSAPSNVKLDPLVVSVTVTDPTVKNVEYQIADTWSSGTVLTQDVENKALWNKSDIENTVPNKVFMLKVTPQNGKEDDARYYKVTVDPQKEIVLDSPSLNPDLNGFDAQINGALDSENITENAISGDAIEEATTKVAQSVIDDPNTYSVAKAKAALGNKYNTGDVYIHIVPSLDITVEEYNTTKSKEIFRLDVTPVYVVKASTEQDSLKVTDKNSEIMGVKHALKDYIDGEVTVNLPIPSGFAVNENTVYVKLENDNYSTSYVVQDGASSGKSNYIEVKFPHFSEVTITKNATGALVDDSNKYYDTLQDAVDAIAEEKNGSGTITLYSAPEEAIVTKAGTITLKAEGTYKSTLQANAEDKAKLKEILKAGEGLKQTGKLDGDVTNGGLEFVFEEDENYQYPITIESSERGTVITNQTDNKAQAGTDVILTVTPNTGYTLDELIITNANTEEAIEFTDNGDGTYTFKMPAAGVIVEASFVESGRPDGPNDPSKPDTPADPTTGQLTVSKAVVGDEGDKTKEFNFTVTLSDTTISGAYGDMTFADGVATFKLKDGQSVKASSLPKDITYTVAETEANQDGYTTTSTGATGAITAGGSAAAAFTNAKGDVEPSEGGNLVFKAAAQERDLKDRSTTDKDCTLKLAAEDGEELADDSIEITSSNPKVVRVLKSGKLRYMDLGTAEITVTATGKNGKTYTITFPVKVTKLGRPTLTVSNKISKTAKTFTVTTSTVRGADGFIVKYSLKKNMSNSGKKKFVCGKKLKRQAITVKKAKTTYYVKVRAYKKVDGKIKKYAWSKETEKIKSR